MVGSMSWRITKFKEFEQKPQKAEKSQNKQIIQVNFLILSVYFELNAIY